MKPDDQKDIKLPRLYLKQNSRVTERCLTENSVENIRHEIKEDRDISTNSRTPTPGVGLYTKNVNSDSNSIKDDMDKSEIKSTMTIDKCLEEASTSKPPSGM